MSHTLSIIIKASDTATHTLDPDLSDSFLSVSAEASVGDLQLQTNNVVRKHRKEKGDTLYNDIHRNLLVHSLTFL